MTDASNVPQTPQTGEPLPCPFCGGETDVSRESTSSGLGLWRVCCDSEEMDCSASGPFAGTRDLAIAAWNRRSSPPEERGERESEAWAVVDKDGALAWAGIDEDTLSRTREAADLHAQALNGTLFEHRDEDEEAKLAPHRPFRAVAASIDRTAPVAGAPPTLSDEQIGHAFDEATDSHKDAGGALYRRWAEMDETPVQRPLYRDFARRILASAPPAPTGESK